MSYHVTGYFPAGCFLGSTVIFYLVSKYYGRTRGMLVGLVCFCVRHVGTLVSSYPSPVFIFSYVIGMTGYFGLFLVSYLYLVEMIHFNKRVFPGISWFTYNSLICFTIRIPELLGEFLTETSYNYFDWHQVSLAMAVITLLPIYLLLVWLPESPKWLLANHKVRQAEQVLNDMAKTNGKDVSVKVDIVDSTRRTAWDGARVHKDVVRVKLGDREEVRLEVRSYSTFSMFNANLLQVGLIPMTGIIKPDSLVPYKEFILGVAGLLFTMVVEGILGRRNCLMIYMSLIFIIGIFSDLMQKANSSVLTDLQKETNTIFLRHVTKFFSEPIISLIYLMTLTIYPGALR